MVPNFLTVAEAADRLGVSEQRIRQLIAAEVLPAERVGARWLLDYVEVVRHEISRPSGRPLSPHMAWGLLLLLDGGTPDWLTARQLARLKRRLQARPDVAKVAALCRNRAVSHRLVGHKSAVGRLRHLPDLVPTGISAGGGIVDLQSFDAYVRAGVLRRVRRELALAVVAPGRLPNVVLRVLPSGLWPFTADVAGPSTVAVDLWDAGDSRSRREARDLFDRLVARWSR